MVRVLSVAVFLLVVAAPASSQIKQWTDEKGVTHFESDGSGPPPGDGQNKPKDKETPGKAKTRIDRTHAGITLGDNDSSYRNSETWLSLGGEDKFRGQIYTLRPGASTPDGVTKMGAMFVDGRLAMIRIIYNDYSLGGWDKAVKVTGDKYGPPRTNGYSEASWLDDQTLLSFRKDDSGGIEVMIADNESLQRYNSRTGQAAPKF